MRILMMLLLMLSSAVGGVLVAPLFASEGIFIPFETRNFDGALPSELACTALADAMVSQDIEPTWSGSIRTGAQAIAGKGVDHLALRIDLQDKTIKLLTTAAVKIGDTDAAKLKIIRDTKDFLTATQTYFDGMVSVLVLKKSTRVAVWTKTSPVSLLGLSGISFFLRCR